jgi:hypothetical protein
MTKVVDTVHCVKVASKRESIADVTFEYITYTLQSVWNTWNTILMINEKTMPVQVLYTKISTKSGKIGVDNMFTEPECWR